MLTLDNGEVLRFPIVAWSIVAGGYGGMMPIAIGCAAFIDSGCAILAPDGRVFTMEQETRCFRDAEGWRASVTCEA